MKQIALPISQGPAPTLDNFVIGQNAGVVHALEQWLSRQTLGSLYISGPAASGKSHLLHAAHAQVLANGQSAGYLTAQLANPNLTQQPVFNPAWQFVFFEDVQLFSQDEQHTVFAWLIHAQAHGTSVMATGDVPPVGLALRDDVRSRLAWGQVHALQPLSEDDCKKVLQSSAKARGIELGDEVVDFVMHRFSRDLGSLTQLLDLLDQYALENKRSVTIPLISAMLRTL